MTPSYPDEVEANLERAVQSIEAARQLMSGGYLIATTNPGAIDCRKHESLRLG